MTRSQAPPLTLPALAGDPDSKSRSGPAADDRAAFVAALIRANRDALMRYLTGLLSRHADAEDVFQETCRCLLEVPHERPITELDGIRKEMATGIALALAHSSRPPYAASNQ